MIDRFHPPANWFRQEVTVQFDQFSFIRHFVHSTAIGKAITMQHLIANFRQYIVTKKAVTLTVVALALAAATIPASAQVGVGTTSPAGKFHVSTTGDANALVVNNTSGNVGIGTAAPAQQLEVAGNVQFSQALMPSGSAGATGQILTSQGDNTAPVWQTLGVLPGSLQDVYNAIGTTQLTLNSGAIAVLPGCSVTLTATGDTNLLITASAVALPAAGGAPVQGTIDLLVDGSKVASQYYSAADAPSQLVRLGNYSTTTKLVSVGVGSHTVQLQAKSWFNQVLFNLDPVAQGYAGAESSDANAMKCNLTVLSFPS